MKSKIIKRITKLSALVVVVVFLFMVLSQLMMNVGIGTEVHVRNFYREPKNSLDVAFIGCSEMYADFSPPIAYDRYGFTSYNLAYEGAPGHFFNSMLDEFLSRQDPQLVVFEVNGFFYNDKYAMREGTQRRWLDTMNKNANWRALIKEYVPQEERINYYASLLKYHANWKEPSVLIARWYKLMLNSKGDVSMMKSLGTRTATNSVKKVKRKHVPHLTDYGRKNLRATIDHCKELGLDNVLFIRTPHKDKLPDNVNAELDDIISGAGYRFVNFESFSDEMGIDENSDYYNKDHLNVFGCDKCTDYISEYITENYDIDTEHSESVDKQWRECAEYTYNAFDVLKERTLEGEDVAYNEFSDLSEKGRNIQRRYQKYKDIHNIDGEHDHPDEESEEE